MISPHFDSGMKPLQPMNICRRLIGAIEDPAQRAIVDRYVLNGFDRAPIPRPEIQKLVVLFIADMETETGHNRTCHIELQSKISQIGLLVPDRRDGMPIEFYTGLTKKMVSVAGVLSFSSDSAVQFRSSASCAHDFERNDPARSHPQSRTTFFSM